MDQARNILNSYIPATQWAMNYINGNVAQPGQRAAANVVKGFNEPPQDVPTNAGFFETTGNSLVNATPAGGLEKGLAQGAHLLSDAHLVSNSSHMLPLALGIVGNGSKKFGSALANAQKGFNKPVHPEDVKELSPIIERLLTQSEDPHYFINQRAQDHAVLQPVAEHYMPGVTKTLQNDPTEMARALLQRIMMDREAIPQ